MLVLQHALDNPVILCGIDILLLEVNIRLRMCHTVHVRFSFFVLPTCGMCFVRHSSEVSCNV